jgi:hypothetical protein
MLIREQWRLRAAKEDAMDMLLAALAGFGAVWLALLVVAGLAAAVFALAPGLEARRHSRSARARGDRAVSRVLGSPQGERLRTASSSVRR